MKKSLFFVAAASALMLTACSSENDVVQSASQQQSEAKALGFDVYMPEAVTRAGSPEGVMTTEKLKTPGTGFGVFAYYIDGGASYSTGVSEPNFMYNEQVHWDGGWTYSPLKYWPNETTKDSQTPAATATPVSNPLDKLSFFAYAPYVDHTASLGTYGITGISANTNDTNDPYVTWTYSTDIDKGVDLLWGVAPKGMDYTAVNGLNVPTTFGMPLIDLVKPDKDLKVKFLFQHALSRVGLTVVSAIDQIAAGDDGGKFDNNLTRVLIEKVDVWGDFGETGTLSLNNTNANEANWSSVTKNSTSSISSPFISFDNGSSNFLIAKDLRYNATAVSGIEGASNPKFAFLSLNEGVLPSEKVLIAGGPDEHNKVTLAASEKEYSFGTAYYTMASSPSKEMTAATVPASEDVATYIQDAAGNYIQVKTASSGSAQNLDGVTKYYKLAPTNKKTGSLTAGDEYYEETGTDGNILYRKFKATGSEGTGSYYATADMNASQLTSSGKYGAGTYYKGLAPRYFMVIPSDLTPTPTNIGVTITYHVITYDEKLKAKVSDVKNVISKTTTLQLESGKSYNLKLILGLTSVKLDATVGEWQVGDDAEIWVPQNVE